jgi:hypothetical protein
MTNIIKTQIHISNIKISDTIEHQGSLVTVNKNDISKGFCGITFRGDASKKYLTKITFKVPTNLGIILR